jgi:hypothetical protein
LFGIGAKGVGRSPSTLGDCVATELTTGVSAKPTEAVNKMLAAIGARNANRNTRILSAILMVFQNASLALEESYASTSTVAQRQIANRFARMML